jgi:hypothetical protein
VTVPPFVVPVPVDAAWTRVAVAVLPDTVASTRTVLPVATPETVSLLMV